MREGKPAEPVVEFDYRFDELLSQAIAALNALASHIRGNRLSFEQVHTASKSIAQKATDINDAAHRNGVPRYIESDPVTTGQTDTEAV